MTETKLLMAKNKNLDEDIRCLECKKPMQDCLCKHKNKARIEIEIDCGNTTMTDLESHQITRRVKDILEDNFGMTVVTFYVYK
jgi:DTW domain-containing protein YfiP